MTTNDAKLKEKIEKRQETENLLRKLVADAKAELAPHQYEGFARAFFLVACDCVPDLLEIAKSGSPGNLSPMTAEESRQYENEIMGYGQYANWLRADVPSWYMDSAIQSAEKLIRYSMSDAWRSRVT